MLEHTGRKSFEMCSSLRRWLDFDQITTASQNKGNQETSHKRVGHIDAGEETQRCRPYTYTYPFRPNDILFKC